MKRSCLQDCVRRHAIPRTNEDPNGMTGRQPSTMPLAERHAISFSGARRFLLGFRSQLVRQMPGAKGVLAS
jgi:hypothetical protein